MARDITKELAVIFSHFRHGRHGIQQHRYPRRFSVIFPFLFGSTETVFGRDDTKALAVTFRRCSGSQIMYYDGEQEVSEECGEGTRSRLLAVGGFEGVQREDMSRRMAMCCLWLASRTGSSGIRGVYIQPNDNIRYCSVLLSRRRSFVPLPIKNLFEDRVERVNDGPKRASSRRPRNSQDSSPFSSPRSDLRI